jgi:hypothetical protein
MSADGLDKSASAASGGCSGMPTDNAPSPSEPALKATSPNRRGRLLSGTMAGSAADRLEALVAKLAPYPLQEG